MTEQLAQLKPEKMNAADWLKAVHDFDPFHRPVGFVSNLCKNLKIFSNEQLVELFACRAITSQDFDENADKSKLSATALPTTNQSASMPLAARAWSMPRPTTPSS